jgi:hypothetical protein
MARISEVYGGQYMTASDLDQAPKTYRILSVCFDTKLQKIALELEGTNKELMLNKTNATLLAGPLGDDTDQWAGHYVIIRRGRVNFKGQMVDCVEVVGARKEPVSGVPNTPADQANMFKR